MGMKPLRFTTLLALSALTLLAQAPIKTGPAVGATAPVIDAIDQNGVRQSLKTVMGPKGAWLVFFRSADW